ncbi:S-methyl-5-thioribose-1-phosphate isomerase [Marinobacterium sedimentorum]|uniref:S-methyl-5-thioribose-1-phosphate isomerase n=1 Tax=Marinobacterium sedimentorum TaxID=2927804 RepID=UPI0020C706D6|nr:S-methyl-5-thioribose-1-phosphate isomerase [Marinobacterium sedimentorum]MCP8688643.1 S-methyl-5-thioribose-1-phosphate isomerase [Marinobacterium sedimentorum]
MKDLISTSLKYQQGQLWVLDQHQLPDQENWLECTSVDAMVDMIRKLQIRGAPLIGIGASLLLAHLAEQGCDTAVLAKAAATLREARPTAVNLMNCMDRMLAALAQHDAGALIGCAERIFEEDIQLCLNMARNGAALIAPGARILTHCNTGSLATAGVGTAIGVIAEAHRQGKGIHVYVDETRPLLQGGRLTCWEMRQLQVPYTLICDSMAAMLMAQGKIDCILVGSDRIAANGDFANKVGTYSLAVNARYHQVPFYVVAPYTTVDPQCPDGSQIPIEQRAAAEVQGVSGSFGKVRWSPEDAPVYNPAFDVTPAKLVTGWILDTEVLSPQQIETGALSRL